MTQDDSKSFKLARTLALEKRAIYSIDGRLLNLTKIQQIYKQEGINLCYQTGLKNLKALYMADNGRSR